MRTVVIFVVIVMFIAVIGCGGKSAEAPKAPVNQCMVGAPGWVTGNAEGGVTSIGTAAIGNAGMSMARTMALGNARDEMARSIGVKVNNMLKDFTQVTGIGNDAVVDKVTSSVSQQVASQTLQGSVQKGSWVSPCNELYVLMALDAAVVQAAVKQQVNSSYKNEKALWQQFQAQKAQDELSSAIEKEFSPAPQSTVQPVAPQVAPIPAVVVPAAQPSTPANTLNASAPVAPVNDEIRAFELRTLELTNIERAKNKLPPLIWHDALASVARAHSNNLLQNNITGHTGSNGSTPGERVGSANIPNMQYRAENCAYGSITPEDVVKNWMNSSGHKQNIMNASATHLGIGFVKRPEGFKANYATYWTQVFGELK